MLEDPIVRRSFGITRNEIRMVALDRLVVFQKQINLGYARELQQALGNEPTDEDLFNFCLPIDRRYDPPTRVAPIAHGPKGPAAWAMLSPSTDFRVLETTLLDPSQVIGLDMTGAPTQVVAVVVGYGPNFVTAVRAGNRLILRNGSHRVYALRAAGHTHAPVLIQTIAHQDELGLLLPDIESHLNLYVTHPRPPLLRDYFDNNLRLLVHVSRRYLEPLRLHSTTCEDELPHSGCRHLQSFAVVVNAVGCVTVLRARLLDPQWRRPKN